MYRPISWGPQASAPDAPDRYAGLGGMGLGVGAGLGGVVSLGLGIGLGVGAGLGGVVSLGLGIGLGVGAGLGGVGLEGVGVVEVDGSAPGWGPASAPGCGSGLRSTGTGPSSLRRRRTGVDRSGSDRLRPVSARGCSACLARCLARISSLTRASSSRRSRSFSR
jgi:hypothetical protein